MLTVKEAVEVGEKLERSFDDVIVLGANEPIVVKARGHNRLERVGSGNCKHERIVTARDVFAAIQTSRGGIKHMRLADENHRGYDFRFVRFCQRCDQVMDYEEEE